MGFFKVKFKNGSEKYAVDVKSDFYEGYVDEDGILKTIENDKLDDVLSADEISDTNLIPTKTYLALKKIQDFWNERYRKEMLYKQLEKEIDEMYDREESVVVSALKNQGKMTWLEFLDIFYDALPDWLTDFMEENRYSIYTGYSDWGYGSYEPLNSIVIEGKQYAFIPINSDIIKESEEFYDSYDIDFESEEFKKIEKETVKYLPVKQKGEIPSYSMPRAEDGSGIYVGFEVNYEIPLDVSRQYSAEYAKELAKKFTEAE